MHFIFTFYFFHIKSLLKLISNINVNKGLGSVPAKYTLNHYFSFIMLVSNTFGNRIATRSLCTKMLVSGSKTLGTKETIYTVS